MRRPIRIGLVGFGWMGQAPLALRRPERDDCCLSAAGGLPGELTMGWRSKSVGSSDAKDGYSTMCYEPRAAWEAERKHQRVGI